MELFIFATGEAETLISTNKTTAVLIFQHRLKLKDMQRNDRQIIHIISILEIEISTHSMFALLNYSRQYLKFFSYHNSRVMHLSANSLNTYISRICDGKYIKGPFFLL